MYEAQIMWIRSRPSIDIKALAICHGRMGKMFLKLDKFNRAIVEFDRQLSLGNEIDDKPGELMMIRKIMTMMTMMIVMMIR
jgi:hypothetical protein